MTIFDLRMPLPIKGTRQNRSFLQCLDLPYHEALPRCFHRRFGNFLEVVDLENPLDLGQQAAGLQRGCAIGAPSVANPLPPNLVNVPGQLLL
jgi:hypothetical protein